MHDSEVLEPEPIRAGGLMREDVVRFSSSCIVRSHPNEHLSSPLFIPIAHLEETYISTTREALRTPNTTDFGSGIR